MSRHIALGERCRGTTLKAEHIHPTDKAAIEVASDEQGIQWTLPSPRNLPDPQEADAESHEDTSEKDSWDDSTAASASSLEDDPTQHPQHHNNHSQHHQPVDDFSFQTLLHEVTVNFQRCWTSPRTSTTESNGQESERTESSGQECLQGESDGREFEQEESSRRESAQGEYNGREVVQEESIGQDSIQGESTGHESVQGESNGGESVQRESNGGESPQRESNDRESEYNPESSTSNKDSDSNLHSNYSDDDSSDSSSSSASTSSSSTTRSSLDFRTGLAYLALPHDAHDPDTNMRVLRNNLSASSTRKKTFKSSSTFTFMQSGRRSVDGGCPSGPGRTGGVAPRIHFRHLGLNEDADRVIESPRPSFDLHWESPRPQLRIPGEVTSPRTHTFGAKTRSRTPIIGVGVGSGGIGAGEGGARGFDLRPFDLDSTLIDDSKAFSKSRGVGGESVSSSSRIGGGLGADRCATTSCRKEEFPKRGEEKEGGTAEGGSVKEFASIWKYVARQKAAMRQIENKMKGEGKKQGRGAEEGDKEYERGTVRVPLGKEIEEDVEEEEADEAKRTQEQLVSQLETLLFERQSLQSKVVELEREKTFLHKHVTMLTERAERAEQYTEEYMTYCATLEKQLRLSAATSSTRLDTDLPLRTSSAHRMPRRRALSQISPIRVSDPGAKRDSRQPKSALNGTVIRRVSTSSHGTSV